MVPSPRCLVLQLQITNRKFLHQFDAGDEHVNQLDADERNHQAAESIHQQVLPQQRFGAHRLVGDPSQRQRNQGNDDERVKDNGSSEWLTAAFAVA